MSALEKWARTEEEDCKLENRHDYGKISILLDMREIKELLSE